MIDGKYFKKVIESECITIAENLIKQAIHTEEGIYWETLKSFPEGEAIKQISETIYNGVGGITLFFIELYKVTLRKEYLVVIEKSLTYLLFFCRKNETDNYAFFTGRMGVSFVLLKGYELTKNNIYLDAAIEFSTGCENFINKPGTLDDLLNGTAGTLLGLLHIHSFKPQKKTKDAIRLFTMHLIQKAQLNEDGVFWDRSEQNMKGLCGFSHGACGVGWVLLETGNLFNCIPLKDFAMQAVHYENKNFDKSDGNWIDFRKGIYDQESYDNHINAYQKKDMNFFLPEKKSMAAWCHGAPGIGLSRLRYMELLNVPTLRIDFKRALKKTNEVLLREKKNMNRVSFTLCHNFGGNSLILFYAYKSTKQKSLLELFHRHIDFALTYKQSLGFYYSGLVSAGKMEDLSLFAGNAGVGYFLLHGLDANIENYLLPKVERKIPSDPDFFCEKEIKDLLKKSLYPLTFKKLKGEIVPFTSISLANKKLFNMLRAEVKAEAVSKGCKHLFVQENKKFLIRRHIFSYNYNYIQGIIYRERAEELISQHMISLDMRLRLVEHVLLFQNEKNYLIIESYKGSINLVLNDLSYSILCEFLKPASIGNVISTISKVIDSDSGKEIEKYLLDQIKEFLRSGILVES